jgi:hypothetical protein
MGDITNMISNLGFPIFVTIWLLIRTSKDTQSLTDAIISLKEHLEGGCKNGK